MFMCVRVLPKETDREGHHAVDQEICYQRRNPDLLISVHFTSGMPNQTLIYISSFT